MVSMNIDIDNHQYRCHIDRDRYSRRGPTPRRRNHTMSEAYLTNWALGSHFDERDRFHEVALAEARVATERRPAPAPRRTASSLVSRLRIAVGRPVAIEACDCAAAA